MKRWSWTLLLAAVACEQEDIEAVIQIQPSIAPEATSAAPPTPATPSATPSAAMQTGAAQAVPVQPQPGELALADEGQQEQLLTLPVTSAAASVLTPTPASEPVIAARRPPPIQGGTLTALSESVVAISDPDRDKLYFVDLEATETQPRTLTLAEGTQPDRIVAGANNQVHVVLRGSHEVAHIDVAAAQALSFTTPCSLPRGLGYDREHEHLYVACAGGELVELDATGTSELNRVQLARDLRDVVVTAEGLRVSTFRTATLSYLGLDLTLQSQVAPGEGSRPSVTPAGETQTLSPGIAWRTLASPVTGGTVMLHQRAQATPLSNASFGVAYYGSSPSTAIIETTISVFDANGEAVARAPLSVSSLSVDLAVSPSNQWVAVASPGNFLSQQRAGNRQLTFVAMSELESSSGQRDTTAPVVAGRLQTEHVFPGELTSLLFLSDTRLVGYVRQPAQLHVMAFDPMQGFAKLERIIDLDPLDVSDSGHLLFHQAPSAGVSCASCHPGGADDGHVWQFAELGPRRTQTLEGGVMQRAPFHWNGELADFNALMVEIMQVRMASVAPTAELQAALASWLDALPSQRLAVSDPEAVARGALLFASAEVGCAECHKGSDFSSSELYDVGTNVDFKLKAPTLLGMSLRSPLMHNGCAKTLAERFDPLCGGDKHGKVEQLTAPEMSDLVAFLESL